MLASLQWLRKYVAVEGVPQELADALTMAGIPVEEVREPGVEIKNVVTGKILSVEPHPNADKLVVCQVDIGTETLQICTGATNVKPGQIVPVAKPNSYLPGGVHITTSKLRGLPSYGMMCSAQELRLDAQFFREAPADGILIMAPETPVGEDVRPYLGLADTIFEFELTPNRADCFCMVGLAREFAALFGSPLHLPEVKVQESGAPASEEARVAIATPLCERLTARLLRDVRVTDSPAWLVEALRSVGIRSINNVVDVTNYVMLEFGLPLHAYDFTTLADGLLQCRETRADETVVTLDGTERKLAAGQLVMADATAAAGLAGIMGGERTEVRPATTTVLLEAAVFNGAEIRRTSRAHGLRSEASGRYERGANPEMTRLALDRTAQLLQEMAACTVAPGYLDEYPQPRPAVQLTVTADAVRGAIGADIPTAEMVRILEALYFKVAEQDGTLTVDVPAFRRDVTLFADIVEEVARLYGYNRIPSLLPYGRTKSGRLSRLQACAETVRDTLSEAGLAETISFSFMTPQDLQKLQFAPEHTVYHAVPVRNPITEEMPQMRTTLLPGLLAVLQTNLAKKNEQVAIYEYGAVFLPDELPLQDLPREAQRVSGLLYGDRGSTRWPATARPVDFYDLKGILETVVEKLGIREYTWQRTDEQPYHPGKAAALTVNKQEVVTCGELHPAAQEAYELPGAVYLFTLDMELLAELADTTVVYEPLPKFPAVERDLAILVPTDVEHETLVYNIRRQGGDLLQAVELFDLYAGDQVPDGFVSMAFALRFSAPDRTLTDADVDQRIQKIMHRLQSFNCRLR